MKGAKVMTTIAQDTRVDETEEALLQADRELLPFIKVRTGAIQ
jgi:hypothetical protein